MASSAQCMWRACANDGKGARDAQRTLLFAFFALLLPLFRLFRSPIALITPLFILFCLRFRYFTLQDGFSWVRMSSVEVLILFGDVAVQANHNSLTCIKKHMSKQTTCITKHYWVCSGESHVSQSTIGFAGYGSFEHRGKTDQL
jgi:hypothetical protein